jgi:CRISPR/Cas system-associated exonuclease Cas4 (RecB family)
MKKLHIIHAKTLNEASRKSRGKLLPTLEKEVLSWAKKNKQDAHKATVKIQQELQKNPASKVKNKYFKYLRRLLELKLQKTEDEAHKAGEDNPKLKKELSEFLNIESLRIPEHISCSSIGMYEFCPRKWYYRYALGVKFPKTTALHFGSAVDDALNFYYEEKIKGKAPPRSAVHAQFYEEFAKGYDEVNWGVDDPKQLQKNGPVIIDKYLDSFDRLTDAVDVQTEVRIPLDNGGQLLGYIDILEKDAVVDTKTAKKPWNDKGRYAKHLQELQPKAYSLWFLQEFEKMPKQFRYQIVTKATDEKGKATPEAQLISFELKKFELESFRRRIQKIWDDIMAALPKGMEAFPAQAEPGNKKGRGPGCQDVGVLCTQQWCDYHELCTKKGLKIPTRWVSKTKDEPGHHVYE